MSNAPINVVVYEDNPHLRQTLEAIFKSGPDFRLLDSFSRCDDVATQMRSLDPDVVLMDLFLEESSGIEGIRIIKSKFPHIEILVLTSFEDEELIFEVMRLGASGYLLKNTNPAQILDAVREIHSGGSPMSPTIARRVTEYFRRKPRPQQGMEILSSREQEILREIMNGKSQKMIGAELHISYETVRSHIKHIYEKLQVHSATEAISKVLAARKHS